MPQQKPTRQTFREQLAGLNTKPAVPAPVTELRNGGGIIRAIRHAEQELKTHLAHLQKEEAGSESKIIILQGLLKVVQNIGLGQTNAEVSRSINELQSAISALDRAVTDLLAGANAQVAELSIELKNLESQYSLDDILAELESRNKESEKISPIYEGLLDRKADLESRIKNLSNILSVPECGTATQKKAEKTSLESELDKLEATLKSVTNTVRTNRKEVETLQTYENAIRILREGLPKGIIRTKES